MEQPNGKELKRMLIVDKELLANIMEGHKQVQLLYYFIPVYNLI